MASFNDFGESGWETVAGSASVVADIGYGGSRSVYLDAVGERRVRITRTFDTARDFRGKDFSIAVRLKHTSQSLLTPVVGLRDLFGNDLFLSGSVQNAATDRWVRIDLGVKEDRGADLNAIKEIRVDHWAGDDDLQFYVDDLRAHDGPDKGYVMFTFDDADPKDYSVAYPTLKEHGFAGACFPTLNNVIKQEEPPADHYLEMQRDGWDIGGHTFDHANLAEHPLREQKLILERTKRTLEELGFTHGARFFRTPFSNYNSRSLDLFPKLYDATFVGAGPASGTNLHVTDPRTIGFRSGDDYGRAKRLIDAAVEYNQLLGLTFHMNRMPDRAAFESVVGHAASYVQAGRLEVITPSTLLDTHIRGTSGSGSGAG